MEKYEKCSVCGKLVYENRIETLNIHKVPSLFCSDWCVDWEKIRVQKKKQAQKLLI
ncbi:hypothetical protein ACXM0N_18010 [Peribacillus simplex]